MIALMVSSLRQAAIQEARKLWESQPVFLDTETTGLHGRAEIVEISIIDYDGSVLFDKLVKPRQPIPRDAVTVHGITDDMVRDEKSWLHVWPDVEEVLANRFGKAFF